MDRLEKCEKKVDHLYETIIPLLKERNDLLVRAEALLISLTAAYEKQVQEVLSLTPTDSRPQ